MTVKCSGGVVDFHKNYLENYGKLTKVRESFTHCDFVTPVNLVAMKELKYFLYKGYFKDGVDETIMEEIVELERVFPFPFMRAMLEHAIHRSQRLKFMRVNVAFKFAKKHGMQNLVDKMEGYHMR